jgi:hypothetical protein
MRTRIPPLSPPAALLVALLVSSRAAADGIPLGPVPGEVHSHPVVLPDGVGGAVVAYKTSGARVGAVRLDAAGLPAGLPAFDPVTVPLTLEVSQPTRASLTSSGRVLVAADRATATGAAFMRFEPEGAASAGYPLGLGMPYIHPVFVPGSGGRTWSVAMGADATSFWTVRAARIGAAGALEWSAQFASALQFFNSDRLDATTDGAGGLVAVMPYYDGIATGSKDLCVFRLAADGSTPWGDAPRAIVNQPRDQVDPRIVPDGAGGVFMVWTDPRNNRRSSDIFALRLDAQMQRPGGWLFYGQSVCETNGPQSQPRVVRDGLGGIWVAWLDQRDGADGDLRYSHVLGHGALAPGFTLEGELLCAAPGAQRELEIAPDGGGGFFAVWRDERSGEADLYVQHILGSGQRSPAFAPDGEPLTLATGVQDQPSIALVSGARVAIAWRDTRAGAARIYGATIADASSLDAPPVPAAALSLSVAGPARGSVAATVTLPQPGVARVELLDVTGRALARSTLAGPVREALVPLAPGVPIASGLYFVRVRCAAGEAVARVSVLR